jgi:hypothetical protein
MVALIIEAFAWCCSSLATSTEDGIIIQILETRKSKSKKSSSEDNIYTINRGIIKG